MRFTAVSPAHEQEHVIALAVHGVSGFEMVFCYVVRGCMHCIGCQAGLCELPGH